MRFAVPMPMMLRASCLSLVVLAAACGSEERPTPTPGAEDNSKGRYELTTQVDLTESEDWRAAISATLSPLARLESSPGQTIQDELAAANRPVLADLTSKIPAAIEAKFDGWLNDALLAGDTGGSPRAKALADLRASVARMAGNFELVSLFDLDAGGTHTIQAIGFRAGLERIELATPDLPAGKYVEHSVKLPLGNLSTNGMGLFTRDVVLKAGLRVAIGRIIDCERVAKSVAEQCVASVCVGHEDEIKGVCESGLDVVTDVTLVGLKKLEINPLTLGSGDLKMLGGTVEGAWNGSFDLGKGPSQIKPTFSGKRL